MDPSADDPSDPPEANLERAMSKMTFRVEPGRFRLVRLAPPIRWDLLESLSAPSQVILESDEVTLLLADDAWDRLCYAAPEFKQAQVESGLRWIRFSAAMDWSLVGFLAKVTTALAEASIPVGAVCGFHRDHIFVADRFLRQTQARLRELCPEA